MMLTCLDLIGGDRWAATECDWPASDPVKRLLWQSAGSSRKSLMAFTVESRMHSSEPKRVQIGTLILATSCVQLASGFFGTFFSLRVVYEGFDAAMAGLVLSSVYVGLAVGAVRAGRIIER